MKNDLIGHMLKCSDAKGRMTTGFSDPELGPKCKTMGEGLEISLHWTCILTISTERSQALKMFVKMRLEF